MSLKFEVTKDDKTILDDNYPLWKCDVRPNPRHFGLVQVTIGTLAAGTTKEILVVDHDKKYVPSFLVAWNYPAGTSPGIASTNQTFGIGILSTLTPTSFSFSYKMTDKQFIILVNGDPVSDTTNIYAELRYFIFAEDFPLVASSSSFFA